jgi:dTDP-4-dehydrorhamnose reductase
MKVLITGAGGQLGTALAVCAPAGAKLVLAGHAELDIADGDAVSAFVAEAQPDIIINAAAYTAVDKAESEEAAAAAINATAVADLALAAAATRARLVHISTDFVFDGTAHTPYLPTATPNPLCAYGRSKWAGEQAALAQPEALIVRTAWVYAANGSNFAKTMLRLMAERDEVRVVADQIGTPTHAAALARTIWGLIERQATGLYHATDAGVASWYDFALAIQEEALAVGLLERTVPILPIRTSDYPTPAKRPAYSVLDKSATWERLGQPAPHWRVELRAMLLQLKDLTNA